VSPKTRWFPAPTLAKVYLPAVGFLILTLVVHEARDVDFSRISRDPAQEFEAHPLTGAQSSIGGLVWIGAAVVAGLTVALLRHHGRGREERTRFLTALGALTLLLGLDDIFMLHDELGPRYLGIDERPFLAVYGLAALAIGVMFRQTLSRVEPGALALVMALFAGSLLVDFFQEGLDASPYRLFLEDGFKFLGIVGWAGYVIRQCWITLTQPVAVRELVSG
jgi:hypothetical protein